MEAINIKNTSYITLDLSHPNGPTVVYAKQNDIASRYVHATLLENGAAYEIDAGAVALLNITKPDGTTTVTFDGNVISGNEIEALIPDQALTVAGRASAEFSIVKNGDVLSSFGFNINVEESAIDERVLSSNDLQQFVRAVSHLHDHEDAMLEHKYNTARRTGQVAMKADYKDWIISSGNNGYWDYKIYASGICEMYAVEDFGDVAITTQSGNIYLGNTDLGPLFPFDYVDPPIVDIIPQSSGYGVIGFTGPVMSSGIPAVTLFKPVSQTVSGVKIGFRVSGMLDLEDLIERVDPEHMLEDYALKDWVLGNAVPQNYGAGYAGMELVVNSLGIVAPGNTRGLRFLVVNAGNISEYDGTCDNFPMQTVVYANSVWCNDLPKDGLFWLITYAGSTGDDRYAMQLAYNTANGYSYIRIKPAYSAWGVWKVQNENDMRFYVVNANNIEDYDGSCNNFPMQSIAYANSTYCNDLPTNGLFWLITYAGSSGDDRYAMQIAYNTANSKKYVRIKPYNTTWGNWKAADAEAMAAIAEITEILTNARTDYAGRVFGSLGDAMREPYKHDMRFYVVNANNIEDYDGSCNNFPMQSITYANSTYCNDLPTNGLFWLITYAGSSGDDRYAMQIAYHVADMKKYVRAKPAYSEWGSWTEG